MNARGILAVLLAAMLVGSGAGIGLVAGSPHSNSDSGQQVNSALAAQSATAVFLSIDTSTTPDQPTTDEAFDLHVRISSAEAGTNNAYISRLRLVNESGGDRETLATNISVGQVSPGFSISETMDVEIEEEGVHELTLEVRVEAAGRTFLVTRPVTVEVYDSHPVLEAQAGQSMPGRYTDLQVSVGNGLEDTIRNVELTLGSETVEIQDPRRVASQIAAGETQQYTFRARTDSPGENEVRATIRYTTADGERRHVTRTLTPAFSQPEFADDVTVSGAVEPAFAGAETSLNLTVSNGLSVPLRQLEVSVSGDGVSVPQPERVSGLIESGGTRTYEFAVTSEDIGPKPFEVTLSYITEDGATQTVTKTVQTAFREPENPGRVSLTGLQVEREGETLSVSGTAANVGGSQVSGVTIAVGQNDAVRPGRAQSDFFVGSISASDFVSFDVNARLHANTTEASIPLTVSYTVEGVQQEQPVSVEWEAASDAQPDNRGGGLPLGAIAGGAALLLVLVAGVIYWRRR